MWESFSANSLWFFIAAAIVLIALFITRERVFDKIEKAVIDKWKKRIHGFLAITFWTTESIALITVALALTAIVLSREGVYAMITPKTIQVWFLEHGARIIVIFLVGIILWIALKRFLPPLVGRIVVRAKGESKEGIKKRKDTLLSVFMGTGKVFIITLISFMLLPEFNIPVGPILAGFGIAGIAVGFGAQYLIRDLITGVFILMENQYRVGDVAKVADIAGLVEQVNLRKTVLRDLDGIVHHVPNGEIKVASNYTRHFARVNLDISVAYGTDLDHAFNVMNRVCNELAADENWSGSIRTIPQVLRVNKFGDSGIDIKIIGDVKPLEQWKVTGELRKRIKKAFDEEGIEIPWPHVKLYFGGHTEDRDLICQACSQANLPDSKFCSQCGTSLGSQ
ncbi:mechanosensitive ion channel domain-containing protein [Chloroflexota bacterium]